MAYFYDLMCAGYKTKAVRNFKNYHSDAFKLLVALFKHSKFFAPSAKADGKERKMNRNICLFYFCPLPSALADGGEIFECLTGNKQIVKTLRMKLKS